MIATRSLHFTYEKNEVPALSDVDVHIEAGECVVFCGRSGCGKSSLLRCIDHLIPEFFEGDMKGVCLIDGLSISELSVGEVGRTVSTLFQDPRSQFFTVNSCAEVAFTLENHGHSHKVIRQRVDEAFSILGMERLKDRDVFDLSSGEKQLVALVAAWAADTRVILLDEPTANLDHEAVEALRGLLQRMKAEGKTIVLSEHRLYYLTGIADRYILMKDGQVQEILGSETLLALDGPALEARSLRVPDLERLVYTRPLDEVDTTTDEMDATAPVHHLVVENLRFSYRSDLILDDLSLELVTGRISCLIGANGCGKTTLGKILCGLLKASSGRICFDGRPLQKKDLRKLALFIMQDSEYQFFTNSVYNELLYGSENVPGAAERIESLLRRFGLWELRDRHPFSLSGGQMQKLTLLLACLSPKEIVILDEPTAGLDLVSLRQAIDLIKELQRTKIVLIITHDLELITGAAACCFRLDEHRISPWADQADMSEKPDLVSLIRTEPSREDLRRANLHPALSFTDARVKICFFVLTLLVAVLGQVPQLLIWSILLMIFALVDRKIWSVAGCFFFLGVCLLIDRYLPGKVGQVLLNFFPRFILPVLSLGILLNNGEVSAVIAALRKWHCPEKVILVVSIIFRFFPALRKDLSVMRDAIRTRGVFTTLGDKIRGLPAYFEIMIVPFVFRTVRIAETLAATAETRGFTLKLKKTSYVDLHMKLTDWLFTVAAIGLFITLLCFYQLT